MTGLDPTIVSALDHTLALQRIQNDVRSDFIIAPHYSSVYTNIGNELWDEVERDLRSGNFNPGPPITIDVPKSNGLTRPGSILLPKDRLVYQLLVDFVAPTAEENLDRNRVFSNVLIDPPDPRMFSSSSDNWSNMRNEIRAYCESDDIHFAIKADIACFFERLYQHNLINLLHSCGCNTNAVKLLERLLSAWMEKDSHGILQGMFPSDFLGNFYLYGLDSDLLVRDTPFVRYVDDIYVFYETKNQARKGLMNLCRSLRHEGLHLNAKKTRILPVRDLLIEETIVDRLFEEARDEIESENVIVDWYSFQIIWQEPETREEERQIEIEATERLFHEINNTDVDAKTSEKIEKFCLPFLGFVGSEVAVQRAINGMGERPHLSRLYATYLGAVAKENEAIVNELEELIVEQNSPYDWQTLWILASLIPVERLKTRTVNAIFRLLRDPARSIVLRALCAIAIGRHGSPGQRRNLKHHYADEPSEYVRSAIVFATRYFPTPERRTCLGAWGSHSDINSLIASAVSKLV